MVHPPGQRVWFVLPALRGGPESLPFPLGALGFGFGAFGGADGGACSVRFRRVVLAAASRVLRLFVLLTAQLLRGGTGVQRPLLVRLTEGVGAELTEGLRVLPADVAVVPGAVPATCRGTRRL